MLDRTRAPWLLAAAAGAVAFVLVLTGGLVYGAIVGLAALLVGLTVGVFRLRPPAGDPPSPARRRFIRLAGLVGLGAVAVGSAAGRTLAKVLRADPRPALDAMARSLGSEMLTYIRRGHAPGRTGELQLALMPFTVSNYSQESRALAPRDPRTSHAAPWMYLQRVPIVVYAPGIVTEPRDLDHRVSLADLAPTNALLMGFDEAFRAPDGVPLAGVDRPATAPKVIVTFVIDGGGWNALTTWPRSWPNIAALMRDGLVYTNAVIGSFPAVTASAHATIGTGAFPSTHGIVGHNMREGGRVLQPFGDPGQADTSRILVPTLAEAWAQETDGRAWSGALAYQIWHLSMIGNPERSAGDRPVAPYFDEQTTVFLPQHPETYRLPRGMPERSVLTGYVQARYPGDPELAAEVDGDPKQLCCDEPIVRYQGDMILSAFEAEGIGATGVTDLVYINYKAPDYTGHTWNMLHLNEAKSLQHVDAEVGRLRALLEARFEPGEFVLIVTADHGQSPLPNDTGGARVDPIQLKASLEGAFGPGIFDLVQEVKPSEVFIHTGRLWEFGVSLDDLAAHLRAYRYGDSIGSYIAPEAVDERRLDDRLFAAVLPNTYIGGLSEAAIRGAGTGAYASADPGIPEVTWRS